MSSQSHTIKSPMLRMNLGSDFARVRAAAERVKRFLEEHECDDGARADCELAVVEGCNNAIKHAYPNGVRRPVLLEVQVEQNQIELRIIDHGPGFVWPESVKLPDPENESGRGLYLIRVLMDYAAYIRGPKENILVLRKHCSPA
jgi:serine/threonine-protein kinase RsbW